MTDRSASVRLVAPARLRVRKRATGARHQASPPTLNEEAYRRIEEMIVTLELEPGSVVSEAILSERIGIGKTPIREALQRLAREHLVQITWSRTCVASGIARGDECHPDVPWNAHDNFSIVDPWNGIKVIRRYVPRPGRG